VREYAYLGTFFAGGGLLAFKRTVPGSRTPDGAKDDGLRTASTEINTYYPPNRGFLGPSVEETLRPGTVIDRYGGEGGTFAAPQGTPFGERGLAPEAAKAPYTKYVVKRPLPVQAGTASPWTYSLGGGRQYELPQSVADLRAAGYLETVP
jgi:hypothetical protein